MDLVQGIHPRAVHEPLIGIEVFEQVQVLQHPRGSAEERSPRRTPRGYALRGVVRCAACGRKMQGSCNNGKPHYLCNPSASTPRRTRSTTRRRSICARSSCSRKIDAWLSRKFDPVAFTSAVREFEVARPDEPPVDEGAQREIAACDAKLR